MSWSEVKFDSDQAVRQRCADLLAGAIPGNTMSLDQLTELLTPVDQGGANGYQENPQGGPNPILPVYYVYAWSDPGNNITITLAFYKTIKRTGKSTINDKTSKPRRRWWTVNLGCQRPAGGPSIYPQVKEKCIEFFENEMGDINGNKQYLYILDNEDRQPEPTQYKADEVLAELRADADPNNPNGDKRLKVKDRGPEQAYAAFATVPGLQRLSRLEITFKQNK